MIEVIERWSRGEATTEEVERLAVWRRESPANERYCQDILRLLGAAQELGRSAEQVPAPSAAELLARGRGLAAAPVGRAAQAGWAARPKWMGRLGAPMVRSYLPWGVAAAAIFGLTVTLARQAPVPVLSSTPPLEVSTSATELATIRLGDGSVVRLGPSTKLRVESDLTTREVSLRGRAFFSVASDPDRPFSVRTEHGVARVLGTSFELQADESDLRLTVVEGRVALSAGEQGVEVGSGERSGIAAGEVQQPEAIANADEVLQWVGTFLIFQSTPLSVAVGEVERAYGIEVRVTDAEVASRTVTAAFMNQSAPEVLEVLCTVVDARCVFQAEAVVISRQ